ncbi:hypothetical protein [Lutimonas zeaxanthinifaciens]|uniref:hypothetical protein n=1 Tax=Lutimonas zeaxanthinifaciens TaxID=3060215 RepID=UPI00265CBA47|nr:hypothetical protein [Lutimonas sp. YSD2104]WKK67364.1 hypothetical protein QZH61_06980 [Lutimonas sp. YSD2104]
MKKKILYISTNDGSDMRINKEIKTLSKKADIYFLGVGTYGDKNYAKSFCKEFILVEEKRNSLKAIIKQIKIFLKITKSIKFNSIHIINEQLMIFFYPWLFRHHVVLDIFDSIFMKKNQPGNKLSLIKKLVYKPINYVFVTDKNRFNMMPDFIKSKLGILENFPNHYGGETKKDTQFLTIFYNGTMTNERGTKFLQDLLDFDNRIKVIMAGWANDENTSEFSNCDYVDFRGIITQKEATKIAATESDYIMCCYEPSNQNNINASPNKIYDAFQTRTPVIINKEVKVSSFVRDNNIGVVLNSFYDYDIKSISKELFLKKDNFNFSYENAITYSWEKIEGKLLKAHRII